jgi:hypothetical protein
MVSTNQSTTNQLPSMTQQMYTQIGNNLDQFSSKSFTTSTTTNNNNNNNSNNNNNNNSNTNNNNNSNSKGSASQVSDAS